MKCNEFDFTLSMTHIVLHSLMRGVNHIDQQAITDLCRFEFKLIVSQLGMIP